MTRCLTRCFRQLVIAAVALAPGAASAQALGDYASHQQVGRSVVVTTATGQRVRITPYGDAVVRVQAIAGGAFLADDALEMVERHDLGGAFAIADTAAALDLTNGAGARVHVQKAPLRLQLFRSG